MNESRQKAYEKKINNLEQEIKELAPRRKSLSRAHQERVNSYHQRLKALEHPKTLYQRLFGQLQSEVLLDPERFPDTELEDLDSQIEFLKEQRRDCIKIIQVH